MFHPIVHIRTTREVVIKHLGAIIARNGIRIVGVHLIREGVADKNGVRERKFIGDIFVLRNFRGAEHAVDLSLRRTARAGAQEREAVFNRERAVDQIFPGIFELQEIEVEVAGGFWFVGRLGGRRRGGRVVGLVVCELREAVGAGETGGEADEADDGEDEDFASFSVFWRRRLWWRWRERRRVDEIFIIHVSYYSISGLGTLGFLWQTL